jgi:Nitrile hydratase, alpha chain
MTQQMSEERLWGQVVARAWSDEDFKRRLLADPRAVLAEHGIDVPDDVEVRVVEDTPRVRHFTLPPSPAGELADEELVGTAVMDSYSGDSGNCGRCGCGCRRCRCRCD